MQDDGVGLHQTLLNVITTNERQESKHPKKPNQNEPFL